MRRRGVLRAVLLLSLVAVYHRAVTQEQQCRLMITLVDGETHQSVPGLIRASHEVETTQFLSQICWPEACFHVSHCDWKLSQD